MRKETIKKSKVNQQVTYVSTRIGSYSYLKMMYMDKVVFEFNNPIKSIREGISKCELLLTNPNIPALSLNMSSIDQHVWVASRPNLMLK